MYISFLNSWSSIGNNIAFISSFNICVRRNLSNSRNNIVKIPFSKNESGVSCHWTRVDFHKNPSLILVNRKHDHPLIVDLNNPSTHIPLIHSEFNDESKNSIDKMAIFSHNSEIIFMIDCFISILYIIHYNFQDERIQIMSKYDINANFNIRDMRLSDSGNYLICNCSDRVIRGFAINKNDESITQMFKFQDSVTKMSWNRTRVHSSGEFVIAASGGKDIHQLYIWQSTGALLKILEGPKESLIDFDCQPNHTRIVSINHRGDAYIWSQRKRATTIAFSSEFEEIDENVYYDEREDEFDILNRQGSKEELLEQIQVIDSTVPSRYNMKFSINETPMIYYPIPMLHENKAT